MRINNMYLLRRRVLLNRMLHSSMTGGVLLLICAVIAVLAANVPAMRGLHDLWSVNLGVSFGDGVFSMPLRLWIDDVLMAVFFFSVGLEIKRELLVGELSTMKKAALPMFAALGGMIFPALIYTAFNAGTPSASGWGIPMATDIAFAIGVLSLLGTRCPVGLKVFLVALAVVDDIGAIIVLAVFYPSHDIHFIYLLYALITVLALVALNRAGVKSALLYLALGVVLFVFVFRSGVHATIAGVILAMTIPARSSVGDVRAFSGPDTLLCRMESALHPWVTFFIMPVFALANAGVVIDASALGQGVMPAVIPGVFFGLLVGKPLGILTFSWLAVKLRLADLPSGTKWKQVLSLGILGGIGFTMSIFIDNLAFSDPYLVNAGKIAILATSIIAACTGVAALYMTTNKNNSKQ
ncbi:MAG TPA: Na+/H+ antiporter NhaA [Candidatus Coprenecus stercoravium]|uniref:Na(+)/H(+) antiporter NhaA n=1 Tax=Candidatus Coprenecus stercoravium TaxID=2840735 RepID=A0A9D2GRK0_9BACT|nr:Na+/H+ antiporter NhaA [Candidatus Coprenecus stercoravium]